MMAVYHGASFVQRVQNVLIKGKRLFEELARNREKGGKK
jgi:hypothetical protein